MPDLLLLSALAVLAMLGAAIAVTRLLDHLLTARIVDEIDDELEPVPVAPRTQPLRALVA